MPDIGAAMTLTLANTRRMVSESIVPTRMRRYCTERQIALRPHPRRPDTFQVIAQDRYVPPGLMPFTAIGVLRDGVPQDEAQAALREVRIAERMDERMNELLHRLPPALESAGLEL